MSTETEEGPLLLTLTRSAWPSRRRRRRRRSWRAARGAEGDREALRLERALAPLREALAKAGCAAR